MSAPVQDKDALVIDARGLNCPLPVLRLRKRLQSVPAGAWVHLLATDRATLRDIPVFCASQGLEVGTISDAQGELTFRIRKSMPNSA